MRTRVTVSALLWQLLPNMSCNYAQSWFKILERKHNQLNTYCMCTVLQRILFVKMQKFSTALKYWHLAVAASFNPYPAGRQTVSMHDDIAYVESLTYNYPSFLHLCCISSSTIVDCLRLCFRFLLFLSSPLSNSLCQRHRDRCDFFRAIIRVQWTVRRPEWSDTNRFSIGSRVESVAFLIGTWRKDRRRLYLIGQGWM